MAESCILISSALRALSVRRGVDERLREHACCAARRVAGAQRTPHAAKRGGLLRRRLLALAGTRVLAHPPIADAAASFLLLLADVGGQANSRRQKLVFPLRRREE